VTGAGGTLPTPNTGVKPDGLTPVLLVSYYFPPSGGPGVQRVLKFVRYLPQFGFRPLVLTVPEDAAFPVLDPSLGADVPAEAIVRRAPILELYSVYGWLTGRKSRGRDLDIDAVSARPSGFVARLLRAVRGAVFIPDGRVGWVASGTRAGVRFAREERARVVFASGPPFTTHWIAARVARRVGLPLVLDLRDPWTRAPFYPTRPGWARRLDERLEANCLRQAAAVLTVNRAIRDDLLARHADLDPNRFHVVPNGFDPADFEGKTPRKGPVLTLTHTGSLHASRIPRALLTALTRWIEEEPERADDVVLRFVGRLDSEMESLLRRPPFDRIARIEGYRPHGESVQSLLDAHLLLLLIVDDPQSRGMLTGKLFEYLGSGTPILALAPEGEAAEIVRATKAGRVVQPDDTDTLLEVLREAHASVRAGQPAFPPAAPSAILAYSRPELTRRVAEIFRSVGGSA